jgi:hypothetical protein
MSPSETTGSPSVAFTQFLHRPRWPSTFSESLGTSNIPHPPILVEESHFEAYLRFAFAYNLPTCSPPCRSRPGFRPAYGDFYIRASSGLVTRTAAGYDYSGNWASSTGGTHCLTPARPPTSIAATENQDLGLLNEREAAHGRGPSGRRCRQRLDRHHRRTGSECLQRCGRSSLRPVLEKSSRRSG